MFLGKKKNSKLKKKISPLPKSRRCNRQGLSLLIICTTFYPLQDQCKNVAFKKIGAFFSFPLFYYYISFSFLSFLCYVINVCYFFLVYFCGPKNNTNTQIQLFDPPCKLFDFSKLQNNVTSTSFNNCPCSTTFTHRTLCHIFTT